MIRVGVPGFGTDRGRSGIGSYFRELLDRFDDDSLSEEFTFELIGPAEDRDYYLKGKKHIQFYQVEGADTSPMQNFFWNQFSLPKICRERGYDLLFLPAANRRLCGKISCPTVGTVHDLATLHIRNKYDFAHAVFNRKILPFLTRRLSHVLTVSNFSKQDIIRFARVKPEKITVTHLGVDHRAFTPPKDPQKISSWAKEKFGIDSPYILYISRLEHPGKNHVHLIEAFSMFRDEIRDEYQLVLPGPDRERSEEIHAAAEASPYSSSIHFLGFIDGKDVPDLYRGASLFVLPSYFEGFGLPVLEAMACGVPTITSNAASLPEVSGSLSPHFNPDSPAEMKEAMLEVLRDEKRRKALSEQGITWAEGFTWERTVQQTLQVFRDTVQSAKGTGV